MARDVTDGNRRILADVESNKLGHNPRLELARVRMLPTPTEDARYLHRTVPYALQIPIKQRVLHPGGNCRIMFLFDLLLLASSCISNLLLLLDMFLDMLEVEILQALGAQGLRKQRQERLHKVLLDSLLLSEFCLLHLDPLVADLFDLG